MSYRRMRHSRELRRLVPPSRAGRMYLSGKNIFTPDGATFIPQGFNQGHGELTIDSDPTEDISLGANTVRIIWRWWGAYNGSTTDGRDPTGPGNINYAYLEGIVRRVRKAKQAGLKVQLAGDSNCGQNGNQDADQTLYCTVGGLGGQNFFTANGLAYRQAWYTAWRWLVRRCYGLVDFYEPLVEPSAAEATITTVSILQDEVRSIILQEDPYAILVIGGYPSYLAQNSGNTMMTKWVADGNTMLTANLLNSALTGADYAGKVTAMVTARNKWGVPIMCDQFGSQLSSDADNSILISCAEQLRLAAGGSIGQTFWEKVSANTNSYGPYSDDGSLPNGGSRVLSSPARLTVLSNIFKATQYAAT